MFRKKVLSLTKKTNDPFSTQRYDLDIESNGINKQAVDNRFKTDYLLPDEGHRCLTCGKPATHRLIAHSPEHATIELEKIGFACLACLTKKKFNRKIYGIRQL